MPLTYSHLLLGKNSKFVFDFDPSYHLLQAEVEVLTSCQTSLTEQIHLIFHCCTRCDLNVPHMKLKTCTWLIKVISLSTFEASKIHIFMYFAGFTPWKFCSELLHLCACDYTRGLRLAHRPLNFCVKQNKKAVFSGKVCSIQDQRYRSRRLEG